MKKPFLRLCFDTSHQACRIGLFADNTLLNEQSIAVKSGYENLLYQLQFAIFANTSWNINDISAIYVVNGPGSFTGLRIAVAAAKIQAYSLKIPVYTFSSLLLYNLAASYQLKKHGQFLALMDARSDRAYGVYTKISGEEESFSLESSPIEVNPLFDWQKFIEQKAGDMSNPLYLTGDAKFLVENQQLILPDFLPQNKQVQVLEHYFSWQPLNRLFSKIEQEQTGDPFTLSVQYLGLSQAERVHEKEVDIKDWRII